MLLTIHGYMIDMESLYKLKCICVCCCISEVRDENEILLGSRSKDVREVVVSLGYSKLDNPEKAEEKEKDEESENQELHGQENEDSRKAAATFRDIIENRAHDGTIIAHIVCFQSQFQLATNFYLTSINNKLDVEDNSLFFYLSNNDYKNAKSKGIPAYYYYGTRNFKVDLLVDSVQDKSVYRHLVMYDLLMTETDALTTAGDMYWFKNPLKEVTTACGHCDLVIQKEEALDINLGIIYAKYTKATMEFYKALVHEIEKRGVENCRTVFSDVLDKLRDTVNVVTLDQETFPDGPEYFENGDRDSDGWMVCDNCTAVNNNHLMGLEAKVFRLQQHRMWALDENKYYSNPKAKYFIYDNVPFPGEGRDMEDVAALKGSLEVAMATERKAILPPFFHTDDGQMALNGLYLIQELQSSFKEYYRESTFLQNSHVPEAITNNICGPILIENDFTAQNFDKDGSTEDIKLRLKAADPAKGATGEEIVKFLLDNKLSHCSVLRFHSLYHAFKGFGNKKDNNTYFAELDQGLVPGTYRQKELLGTSRHVC